MHPLLGELCALVSVAAFADGVADGAIDDVVLGNDVAVLGDGALGQAGAGPECEEGGNGEEQKTAEEEHGDGIAVGGDGVNATAEWVSEEEFPAPESRLQGSFRGPRVLPP